MDFVTKTVDSSITVLPGFAIEIEQDGGRTNATVTFSSEESMRALSTFAENATRLLMSERHSRTINQ